MSSLKLNLDAEAYIPKFKTNANAKTPLVQPQAPPKTPFHQSYSTQIPHHTSLNINSKSFLPKNYMKKFTTVQPQPPKPKEKKVYKEYFVIDEDDKQQFNFDYDYMISFEKWEICQEDKLLTPEFLKHLEDFKIMEAEPIKQNNMNNKGKKKYYGGDKKNKENEKKKENKDLKDFSRKDFSKEIALAEQFKKNIDKEAEKDPVKFQITELLNILTKDNYKSIADQIYNIIEKDIESQVKFLDVLFNKSVNEKSYVALYAKLCKDFDKKLPQKAPPKEDKKTDKPKKSNSMMRTKLLDKCREIFKIENNEKFDEYIKVQDKEERNIKLKNFVLGNVNFIGELINIQILSKKIVKQCLNNLLERFYDKNSDESLKMINLEAVVILLNNFGTLLKEREKKLKEDDKKAFNSVVDEYLQKLDEIIQSKDTKVDTPVKFKIINLINKSKNNWEKSKFEKSIEAKGKKDLEEDEQIQKVKATKDLYTQDEIINEISRDLVNFKDHIFEEEGTPLDYNWEIVESIYKEHGNSVAEMIQGFLYSCLDFVQNKKTLGLVKDYFNELISYYKNSLSLEEKKEIVSKTNHLLRVARDASLDNLLILDVWCIILSNLIRYHLFNRDDLIELNDLDKEDLKSVLLIIAKSIKEDPPAKIHYEKCKFISQNKELYDEAMSEVFK
jgi:hypothetical protein